MYVECVALFLAVAVLFSPFAFVFTVLPLSAFALLVPLLSAAASAVLPPDAIESAVPPLSTVASAVLEPDASAFALPEEIMFASHLLPSVPFLE